jgi:uncharacterized protein (TIGR03084 family)
MGIETDYLAECEALDAFVTTLGADDFARRTGFYGWTVRDEVMHLYFIDILTLTSIEREVDYLADLKEIRAWQAGGNELSDLMRQRYAALDRDALLAVWRETYRRLAAVFAARDPKARMKWFGPDMSLISAASARQMEVWAHGQDIYDLFGVKRANSDRIRNICEIGVRTQGWTFRNRGLDVPPAPEIVLTAPSGAEWRWNDPQPDNRVTGPAEDFAAVVTQRIHVDDTRIETTGAGARRWMELAQCFAGAPADGPAARSKAAI